METIEQKKAKRFLILQEAYKLSDGNPENEFRQADIERALGFAENEADPLVTYLVNEGLLSAHSFGRIYEISHQGVLEYEAAISAPAGPTHYFPAVNVINIERMEQSQIQQGTVSSSQSFTVSSLDRGALEALLTKLRGAEVALSERDRACLDSDLDTLQAQLKRPEPKHPIIRESLSSARAILEGAGATLLASEIAKLLGVAG